MISMEQRADVIRFEHNGVKYAMTEQEIEAAYRYQEHQYRLADARRQFNLFVFGDDDGVDFDDPKYEDTKFNFAVKYGITYTDASSDDMLEEYLRRYENRFDCNYDENSQWEAAICAVLADR